jgi:hypothetical protein
LIFQSAHSIYFDVLGEHGYVGLLLYLALAWLTWLAAARVVRIAKLDAGKRWAGDLAAMLQVSLVGFAVGGAFLSLAYFDLVYQLIAVIVLLDVMVREPIAVAEPVAPKVRAAGSRARGPQTLGGAK